MHEDWENCEILNCNCKIETGSVGLGGGWESIKGR